MKGILHPKNDVSINPSGNPSIRDLIDEVTTSRRNFLGIAASSAALASVGGLSGLLVPAMAHAVPIAPFNGFGGIGFESIPAKVRVGGATGVANTVDVPPGYQVEVLCAWGQPIMPGAPDWNPDATQTAADQALQMGMHCDGQHYFPFPSRGGPSNTRGIFCCNNEYTEETLLYGTDPLPATIDKVRKSQAAHGVSIFEVRKSFGTTGNKWGVVRTSPYGRRITANTPMRVAGPAAGHELLRSRKFDIQPTGSTQIGTNNGYECNGTVNNCAHGYTPWGTYLTCEENWNGYFGRGASAFPAEYAALAAEIIADNNRYGVVATPFGVTWPSVDPRFNAETNPLEPVLFGWVVEIDPFDPTSTPVKRTSLGRIKHESAQFALSSDAAGTPNRVAFYQGDDERNEYVYKFVCAGSFNPTNRAANRDLLDTGTLYVARFTATPVAGKPDTYRGEWIPLVPSTLSVIPNGSGGFYQLRELRTFTGAAADGIVELDDARVLARIHIHTRQAADAVGATMMDRPEWTAVRTYNDGYGYGGAGYGYDSTHPLELYCTMTNNNRRGGGGTISSNNPNGTTAAGSARPPVDVANPRPDNDFGHIIRWREDGNYVTATGFEWDLFVLAGDTLTTKTLAANYSTTNFVPGSAGGPEYQGNIIDVPAGSADFGAPDGLWFDQFGRMWIQTDQQGDGGGDFNNIGACSMLCADPNTKEIRRFLNGPNACEVTGVVSTPDGRTMFVGIQHPGEGATVANPTLLSNWPQSQYATNSAGEPLAVVGGVPQPAGASIRPRSAVLVITRTDGGVIGA